MGKTYRNIPSKKWTRTPRHKWKLASGKSPKDIVTNWDDKPIAANKEKYHRKDVDFQQ
jgi:hypothetical protein